MPSPRLLVGLALSLLACASGCAAQQDASEGDDGTAAISSSEDLNPAYAPGKRHSVMTAEIVASLKRVLADGSGNPHQFIKVGDSITASTDFLDCLATSTDATSTVEKALAPNGQVRATANLNLRSGAATSFDILAVIPSGTLLKLLDPTPKGGFLNVDFNGTAGWSSQSFLAEVAQSGTKATEANDAPFVTGSAELEATRAQFNKGSWQRLSKSATPGWHTTQPLAGDPTPIDVEIDAMSPSLAVVMLGTNDNYVGTDRTYRTNLTAVVDALLTRHVVPILSTIPPSGRATLDANVPRMNAIVRSIASAKKIPLMDFHDALLSLPGKGLSSDTIHPNVAKGGACDFSASGLSHGYNVRTLLALEALTRVKQFVLESARPEEL